MHNKKKYLLLILAGLVIIVAAAGYYFYNKPALDVKDADGQKVAAGDLYATFIKDSTAAKQNYTNKILEVPGTIASVTKNQQQQPILLLKTKTEGAAINCTLEGPAGNVVPGQQVRIKGICSGIGEGDADLGIMGDVYMVRCYVVNN